MLVLLTSDTSASLSTIRVLTLPVCGLYHTQVLLARALGLCIGAISASVESESLWFCAPSAAPCRTPAGAAGVLCRTWIIIRCCHTALLPFVQMSVAVSFGAGAASKVGVLFSLWTTRGSSTSLWASPMWPRPQQAWLCEHTPFVEFKTSLLRSPLICSCIVLSFPCKTTPSLRSALPSSPFQ